MRVVVISKEPFNITTYESASKIEYDDGIYEITVGSTNYRYSSSDYIVRLI